MPLSSHSWLFPDSPLPQDATACCVHLPVYHLLPATHRSTLAYQQVPYKLLQYCTRVALAALRAKRLITLRPHNERQASHWQATHMGLAVYASSLPTAQVGCGQPPL
jgi:hypothetical protein